jgi:hypothetical protein
MTELNTLLEGREAVEGRKGHVTNMTLHGDKMCNSVLSQQAETCLRKLTTRKYFQD